MLGSQPYLLHNQNNFDCLRLLAALLVVFAHSFMCLNLPQPAMVAPADPNQQITVGTLGVTIFFVISGFLITRSYLTNNGNIINYAKSRVLRIYPALLVQYLLVALVIGALATTLKLTEYYSRLFAIPHLALIPFGFSFPFLPGVFEHNPKPGFVNENLWTLGFELTMYVAIAIILKAQTLFKVQVLLPCALLYGAYLFRYAAFNPHNVRELGLLHCWSFLLGSLGYVYFDKISLSIGVALTGAMAMILSRDTVYYVFTYTLATAYIVLFVAFLRPKCRLYKYGDFSYGIYLYGFPVEQYYATLGEKSLLAFLAASIATSVSFAALSWFLVEKPALLLKSNRKSSKVEASLGELEQPVAKKAL
jgi:peptidoglycan/LPS O-acetylase OafA/YrhL